jgi:hypothetical protein
MKLIPVLFNPDMSAAVRRSESPKTQTRRKTFKGSVGDTIWGRETFYARGEWLTSDRENDGKKKWTFHDLSAEGGPGYLYDSDNPDYCLQRTEGYVTYYRRPSLFMPKAACRMHLLIKSIRHEALQDISEADAIAEGIEPMLGGWRDYQGHGSFADPRESFESLWDSINDERGFGWDTNPSVVAVEFEQV